MKRADDEVPSHHSKKDDDIISEASNRINELAKPNKKIQILDDIITQEQILKEEEMEKQFSKIDNTLDIQVFNAPG